MTTKAILKKAYRVYAKHKKYKQYRSKLGFDVYYHKDKKKNEVTLYIDKTNQTRDWIINLWARKNYIWKKKTMLPQGAVHRGYYWGCIDFMVFAAQSRLIGRKDKIFITGYSYGGGATKVLHALLAESLYDITSVAMQGAKTINKSLDDYIKDKGELYTVINGNDIVTKCPFWCVQGGKVIRIGKKHRWWKLGIKLRFDNSEKGLYKFFTIPDHKAENFMNSFKKYLNIK